MVIRGPKELLSKLLNINEKIKEVESVAVKWKLDDFNKELLLKRIIIRSLSDEE